jgi:hypothetical protein
MIHEAQVPIRAFPRRCQNRGLRAVWSSSRSCALLTFGPLSFCFSAVNLSCSSQFQSASEGILTDREKNCCKALRTRMSPGSVDDATRAREICKRLPLIFESRQFWSSENQFSIFLSESFGHQSAEFQLARFPPF